MEQVKTCELMARVLEQTVGAMKGREGYHGGEDLDGVENFTLMVRTLEKAVEVMRERDGEGKINGLPGIWWNDEMVRDEKQEDGLDEEDGNLEDGSEVEE